MTPPKVSVLATTHNHARYVAQMIESVLQQKTTFPFELVIGEDASTDGTREIVARYQRQAPGVVRPLFHEKNLGVTRNTVCALEACKGKYIALLDGDDFWTSDEKLEVQAAVLDAHPETAICGHRAAVLFEAEEWTTKEMPLFLVNGFYPDLQAGVYGIEDLARSDFLPTSSVMFRNGLIPRFPEWFFDLYVQDVPLHLLNALGGNIIFLSEIMATYRMHGGSLFASRDSVFQLKDKARTYETLYANFDERYRHLFAATLFEVTYELSRKLLDDGFTEEGRRYCRYCLSLPPPAANLRSKAIVGMQAYAPWLYRSLMAAKRMVKWVRA